MKIKLIIATALLVSVDAALAQVPSLISYQARVQASGTNFSGTGQFKFAFVSPGTNVSRQATAAATVTAGFVTGITVTEGGGGYAGAPAVTIIDATGTGAAAVAQVSGGVVTNIAIQNAGTGYSASPTVTIAPPPVTIVHGTFWSNDGTSSAGSEPASAVPVTVQQGLFTMFLGDTNLPNMQPVPATVFNQDDVRLRIWFSNGTNAFAQLSPDQRLGSVGYAMKAGHADQAQIATQADNATSANQIAWTGITGIPAGFADGVDDDTTYSAGTGLSLSGTTFSIANNGVNAGKLANDSSSLGKLSGSTIFKLGSDIAIGMSGQPLRATLHVATDPSGIDLFARRIAIFENSAAAEISLRTGSSNALQRFHFDRPIGQAGLFLEYGSDGLFELWRNTFTGANSANTERHFAFDMINGRFGIRRTPAANELEVGGNASKGTAGNWLANSDRRIKTKIRDIPSARETVMKLRPVRFRYTDEWRQRNPSIEDRDYHNFIAQEYREVFPHAVKGSGEYLEKDPQEILQLDTHDAQIVTVKAVQELIQENKSLRAELNELKVAVAQLQRLLSLNAHP